MKKSIHSILVLAQLDKNLSNKVKMSIRELPAKAFIEEEAISLHTSILKMEAGKEEIITCISDSSVSLDDAIEILNSSEYKMFIAESEEQQTNAIKTVSNDYVRDVVSKILEDSSKTFNGLDKHSNLLEEYEEVNTKITRVLPSKDITTLADAAGSIVEEMLRVKEANEELFFPTPFNSWNREIDGIIPGRIYTVGAASNAGKSALACYLSYEFSKSNKKILYISTESSDIRLYPRFSYIQSYFDQVPSFNRSVYLSTSDKNIQDITNMSSRVAETTGNRVHFLHTSNPVDILSTVTKADDYDIILLDHLHNVDGVEEVPLLAKFMVDLQKICSKYRRSLILFAQYNKTLSSKEVKPTNLMLKGSSAILHCSDIVSHLWYPNYKDYPNTLCMYTEKNRDLPVRDIAMKLEFVKDKQVLIDMGEISFSDIDKLRPQTIKGTKGAKNDNEEDA